MAESNPQDEVDVELPVEESPEALPSDADQDSDAEADETTGGGVPVDDSKGEDCPPCKGGAPGWMATFADMATLLMAFFVLILSFSDTELPKFEQINGSIQAAFGIKKIIPTITIPMARSIIVEDFTPALAEPTVVDNQEQQAENPNDPYVQKKTEEDSEDFPIEEQYRVVESALAEAIEQGQVRVRIDDEQLIVEVTSPSSGGGSGQAGEQTSDAGSVDQQLLDVAAQVVAVQSQVTAEVQVYVAAPGATETETSQGSNSAESGQGEPSAQERFERISAALNTDIEQGRVEVERQGDAVVVRLANQGTFVSGSADLQTQFLPLLTRVGQSVAEGDGRINVEGHTDNIPIAFSEQFNSNWDLSAARAASVADFFNNQLSIGQERLQVLGFADTRPLETNASAAGRARNRRIEIIVDN
ncbi:MAG: flagellar motor protein MotB [Pseudohongiellaceae bacterium]